MRGGCSLVKDGVAVSSHDAVLGNDEGCLADHVLVCRLLRKVAHGKAMLRKLVWVHCPLLIVLVEV